MQPYSCLILEDEPIAAEILSDYIDQVPFLELVGSCTHAMAASAFLQRRSVEVLFLDLHLPGMQGFDFLSTLHHRPQVIVTTAYHKYALDGYEQNVVDYLMKPIGFDRFVRAVNKLSAREVTNSNLSTEEPLDFKFAGRTLRLWPTEMLYVESQRDYCIVHLPNRTVRTKISLSALASRLDPNTFLRIHRSYLVRLDQVAAFSSTTVEVNGTTLPIGSTYRRQVGERLHR